MADERLRNKSELKRLFTNLRGKNITEEMMSIAIDSLWRDKLVQRTSGFEFPGHFDSEISFDTSTRIFSIKAWDPLVEGFLPRYGVYSYLDHPIFHRHFEPFEIEIPNEEGLFCVYFDNEPEPGSSLILFYKKNPTQQELEDIYVSKILVSCFYWDATNDELLHFGEDRHGSEWNPHIQWYLHSVFGAKRKSGLQITGFTLNGDGTLNSHATFSVTGGIMLHDDIEMSITGKGPGLPILYAFGGLPRFIENNGYAFYSSASRPCFNSGLTSISEAASGSFILYHIFATNELLTESRKIVSVMGTAQYSNLARAFKAIDSELDSIYTYMPFQGRCYLDTIILEVNDAYANDVKARIVFFGSGISHPPVTIHQDSTQFLEIDEFQVLKMIGGGTGEDGITPHIGINGNWYIGETDTGVPAQGVDGDPGADGAPGTNGTNGNTPYIEGGYWYIGGSSTGILAQGQNGAPGADGEDGADASVLTGTPVDNGALYNWYSAFDNRKISSSDVWDIVTYTQLQQLGDIVERTLNGYNGHFKLMESGTVHWQIANGTDDFGLNIRGTGRRSHGASATFGAIREACFIWINHTEPTIWEFMNTQDNFYFTSRNLAGQKTEGNPLRLTRAATTAELLLPNGTLCENYVGNNLISYPTVKIGSTIYMIPNLNETKYRNGDWITGFDNGVYTPITSAIWGAKITEAMCYYSDNVDTGGLEYLPGLIGPKGADGKGIVSIILTNTVGLVDTYTITFTDTTTSTFDVTNGTVGADGNTPYIQGGYWYIDGVNTGILAVGQNGLPGTPGTNGTNGSNGIDAGGGFEFCITPGVAQTETLDLYASANFPISKVVLESNGTLNSVTIKIGATAITGLNAVAVSTLQEFTPSANNVVAIGNRITIEIGTGYSGNPTIIRGKILA